MKSDQLDQAYVAIAYYIHGEGGERRVERSLHDVSRRSAEWRAFDYFPEYLGEYELDFFEIETVKEFNKHAPRGRIEQLLPLGARLPRFRLPERLMTPSPGERGRPRRARYYTG